MLGTDQQQDLSEAPSTGLGTEDLGVLGVERPSGFRSGAIEHVLGLISEGAWIRNGGVPPRPGDLAMGDELHRIFTGSEELRPAEARADLVCHLRDRFYRDAGNNVPAKSRAELDQFFDQIARRPLHGIQLDLLEWLAASEEGARVRFSFGEGGGSGRWVADPDGSFPVNLNYHELPFLTPGRNLGQMLLHELSHTFDGVRAKSPAEYGLDPSTLGGIADRWGPRDHRALFSELRANLYASGGELWQATLWTLDSYPLYSFLRDYGLEQVDPLELYMTLRELAAGIPDRQLYSESPEDRAQVAALAKRAGASGSAEPREDPARASPSSGRAAE